MSRFQYSRKQNQEKEPELAYLTKQARQVPFSTFKRNVNANDFTKLTAQLGYSKHFSISSDGFVTYYLSQTPEGEEAYFLVHDANEYVFY